MTDPTEALAARFRSAAACLNSEPGGNDPAAKALLRYLDYADGSNAEAHAKLLLAAAKLRRLFQLPVSDAPGLVFFGGEADPGYLGEDLPAGSLSGSGLTPRRAFESCVGEGIEYLSQFARATDIFEIGTIQERCGPPDDDAARFVTEMFRVLGIEAERPIGWVPAQRFPGGETAWFPADLCLRRSPARSDFVPPLKLSTGCSAGATEDDATARAVLELVERDAAALWWRGGRRGRAVPTDSAAGLAATALLEQLRQGHQERRCWLLDITTDLEIPVIAAISTREDGFGFAFGLGARPRPEDAARAAIFEMCQSELAHHVVAAKRHESGDVKLNESDQRRLRHGLIDTRNCALLQPDGESRLGTSDEPADARQIMTHLAAKGVTIYLLGLTRPEFGVPVIRALAPRLQAEPCSIVGERLAATMRETGGGAVHTGGVALL